MTARVVRDFPLGGRLDRARAWLDARAAPESAPPSGADEGPSVDTAATVLLVRDEGGVVEVFTLRRAPSMVFAPGTTVFPGGRVEPGDFGEDLPWGGPPPAVWAERLGATPDLARAVVAAAVRELFEECGVLLAGPSADRLVDDVRTPLWRAERAALLARRTTLAELLGRHALLLRSDLLAPRARWVTPEFENRRYDTWFLTARLPDGQQADDESSETDLAGWADPAVLLDRFAAGSVDLLPPTVVALESVAAATSAAAFVAQEVKVEPVLPVLVAVGGDVAVRCELPV